MKIVALCPTYNCPVELGYLIACFEHQDYENRHLLVLDDANQLTNQEGDRWKLVSHLFRYPTLGQKRNVLAKLAIEFWPDTEAFALWDSDDLYLSHALSASVDALRKAPWSRPSVVLHPAKHGLQPHRTASESDPGNKLFQGGWSYSRKAFDGVGGYPSMDTGEDQALAARFAQAGVTDADPIALGHDPFYIFNNPRTPQEAARHLSCLGKGGYARLGRVAAPPSNLRVVLPPHIDIRRPTILPGVKPRIF